MAGSFRMLRPCSIVPNGMKLRKVLVTTFSKIGFVTKLTSYFLLRRYFPSSMNGNISPEVPQVVITKCFSMLSSPRFRSVASCDLAAARVGTAGGGFRCNDAQIVHVGEPTS